MLLQPVAEALIHGRHAEEHRAPAGELAHDVFGREGNEDGAAAAEQSPVQTHPQAMQVEKRERVDEHVA